MKNQGSFRSSFYSNKKVKAPQARMVRFWFNAFCEGCNTHWFTFMEINMPIKFIPGKTNPFNFRNFKSKIEPYAYECIRGCGCLKVLCNKRDAEYV